METVPVPPPLTWGLDSPFRYIGGDPSLDLVNTTAWSDRGLVNDRLTDYARLVEWAVGAGLVRGPEGARLRRLAAARPAEADAAWQSARALRVRLQHLFVAVATGAPIDAPLQRFNPMMRDANARMQLVSAGPAGWAEGLVARWSWHDPDDRLDAVLWPVVRAAAELLVSEEAVRIGLCGGDGCGWLYVDRSRNRLRRWCEMETCGTQAKSRRRAERGARRTRKGRG